MINFFQGEIIKALEDLDGEEKFRVEKWHRAEVRNFLIEIYR